MRATLSALCCVLLAGCVPGGVPTAPAPDLPDGVRRTCADPRGVEVARAPSEGRTRWRIVDSAPGTTVPRAQYVTGFLDGCAREVTAALVLFGAPSVHETVRYAAGNSDPYSSVDTAYERVKGRVCGVGTGAGCPADRRDALARRTVFVTIYPRFGGPAELELLLDDGRLVAADDD